MISIHFGKIINQKSSSSEQVLMINAQDSKKTTTKVINTIITPVKRTRPPETIVRLSTK